MRIIATSLATAAAVTALAIAAPAAAQTLGRQGQFTIGAERLFGLSYTHLTYAPDNIPVENSVGVTVIGLGWNAETPMGYQVPRAGLDYFVADRLSLGGGVGFFSVDARGGNNYTGLLFSPRIGYAVDLGRVASFWPRAGVTYVKAGDDHTFGFTGEANFAIFPRDQWAFLISPTLDVAPLGRAGDNQDLTGYSLGLSFGLLGVI